MDLEELAKEHLDRIKTLNGAAEMYRRGEIDAKNLEAILDEQETFTKACDKLVADLEEHLNKLQPE